MNHNVFYNMIYLLIDMEAFPPGWSNVQRHNGHAVVLSTIGNQSSHWPHLKTHSRVNKPSVFDENGIVIENGTTVEQFILAGEVSLMDSDDIIYAIASGVWHPEGGAPSEGQIAAVTNKISITEHSCAEVKGVIAGDAEYWGELD